MVVEDPNVGEPRRARLTDVAAMAGVSTATASRSLRPGTTVAPETRRRVVAAARDLAYVNALDTVTGPRGRTPAVAVIAPFLMRWYFGTATAAALDHLRAHGYDVVLHHLGNPEVRDRFFERMPLAGSVEAVITLSMPLTEDHTLALRALGLPLVSIGSVVPGAPAIGIDDVASARAAVDHLINLGHERIGHIGGRADDERFAFSSSADRHRGYAMAMAAAGLEPDPRWHVTGPHGVAGGTAAMTELLARPDRPTAVLAEYDELALGALGALRSAGLRAPEDLSIIGIDDHEMASVMGLTTMAQDVVDQGRRAAQMVLQLLGAEPGDPPSSPVVAPSRLVLRGSTAPPRTGR